MDSLFRSPASFESSVVDLRSPSEVQKGHGDADGARGSQRCCSERTVVLLESGLPCCSSWIFNIRAPKHAVFAKLLLLLFAVSAVLLSH